MFFDQLKEELSSNLKLNQKRIEKAYNFAKEVHKGQKRASGIDYITHPVEVARIVHQMGGNEDMICAALLHDTIEDGNDPKAIAHDMHKHFGEKVYKTVQVLSKNPKIKDKTAKNAQYYEKIKKNIETDAAVFFVKAADIIHNMETIAACSIEKQELWIKELKERYIPLFIDYFHKIPFDYHIMYEKTMHRLYQILETKSKLKN